MVALGQDLREQWLQRPHARLPLWGEATDESAFEHYRRAAELIKPLDDQRKTLGKMLRDSDAEIALRCMDLRAAWRPSLSAMRLGAHSLRALDLTATSPGEGVYPLIHYRSVSNAAALEARILRHEGDLAGSIRLTLDTMAMASDIFHSGVLINQMIGIALLEIAMSSWPDAALANLKEHDADRLASGLKRLDARMPPRMLTNRETVFMTEAMQMAPSQGEWPGMTGWRYGFSGRWMMAEAVLMTARNFERLEQISDCDWPTRKALFEQILAEVCATENSAAQCMFPNLVHAESSIRRTVGNLRLLRMALDMHRQKAREPLSDPFSSGALLVEKAGDSTLIKSIGPHGARKLERLVTL